MKKRILASILSLCLMVGLFPVVASAATVGGIVLGGSNLSRSDKLWFGNYDGAPIDWGITGTGTQLSLFSEYVLFNAKYHHEDANTTTHPDLTYANSGLYTSTLQNFKNSNFTLVEQGVMGQVGLPSSYVGIAYNRSNEASTYWLGKPFTTNGRGVYQGWYILPSSGGFDDYEYLSSTHGVRPAFDLNLSSVLFASAAERGKSSGTVGATALNSVSDNTSDEWKLTLLDSSRSFSISNVAVGSNTVTFDYSGAKTGTNEYISAIIKGDDDSIKYYGRIAQPSLATGSLTINLSAVTMATTDTLHVFSEQVNADKQTDYASALVLVDTTAPNLTAGAVSRTGVASATVKFTSNEAGAYYYKMVASGGTAPTIDTTVTGISCGTSEQTINLSGLTAGAKDIYIVVKDSAGNVSSDTFKIAIPAYIAPTYTATLSPSGKDFGSQTVGYSSITPETFTVTSTGNQGLTTVGVTLGGTNSTSFALDTTGTLASLDESGGTTTTTTFTVKPNDSLTAGTYTATIEITADNMTTITETIEFKVNPRTSSGSGNGSSTYVYSFTAGANGTWNKRATQGLTFTCTGPFNAFSGIWVDGRAIASTNYTALSGSTVVTLTPAYLSTLDTGDHTIRFIYNGGYAQTSFTVAQGHANPKTGVDLPFTD